MNPPVFEMLHDLLVQSYGLKSTTRMSSREALGLFLWMIGPPEPVRQAEDKFTRSMETISRKFEHVLQCVCNLAKDIIRPKDPTFRTVHPKIANHKYAPFFNNAIGAIDGTHVKVIVPGKKVGPYFNRSKEKSQMCWQYVTSTRGSRLSQLGFLDRHMIGLSYKRRCGGTMTTFLILLQVCGDGFACVRIVVMNYYICFVTDEKLM